MTKFIVISVTIIIFVVSFFYGKSLNVAEVADTSDENIGKVIEKVNDTIKTEGIVKFDKEKAEKSSKKEQSGKNLAKIKERLRYRTIAEVAGIDSADNPLLETIIGLENPQEIDHYSMEEINNSLQEYTKKFPDKAFNEIKNILDSQIARKDPAIRGNLFVAASFITGKEEQVKEITMKEMENNIVKKDDENIGIGGNKKPIPNPQEGQDMAVVLAYNAYLAASHLDSRQVDSDTIEIIKKQPNESLRRQIALTYDRAFPKHRDSMLNKLKEEGIKLFPDDFVFPSGDDS